MASQKPPDGKQAAAPKAVDFHGFFGVLGA
jgi:hypothetical protein